mmetsp:Transcript_36208/g.65706  ORF Transcript_36208/g.65706 Transcript_36208/m.65706 type:complete len:806 (-) Transcript_36208:92-2509(-)
MPAGSPDPPPPERTNSLASDGSWGRRASSSSLEGVAKKVKQETDKKKQRREGNKLNFSSETAVQQGRANRRHSGDGSDVKGASKWSRVKKKRPSIVTVMTAVIDTGGGNQISTADRRNVFSFARSMLAQDDQKESDVDETRGKRVMHSVLAGTRRLSRAKIAVGALISEAEEGKSRRQSEAEVAAAAAAAAEAERQALAEAEAEAQAAANAEESAGEEEDDKGPYKDYSYLLEVACEAAAKLNEMSRNYAEFKGIVENAQSISECMGLLQQLRQASAAGSEDMREIAATFEEGSQLSKDMLRKLEGDIASMQKALRIIQVQEKKERSSDTDVESTLQKISKSVKRMKEVNEDEISDVTQYLAENAVDVEKDVMQKLLGTENNSESSSESSLSDGEEILPAASDVKDARKVEPEEASAEEATAIKELQETVDAKQETHLLRDRILQTESSLQPVPHAPALADASKSEASAAGAPEAQAPSAADNSGPVQEFAAQPSDGQYVSAAWGAVIQLPDPETPDIDFPGEQATVPGPSRAAIPSSSAVPAAETSLAARRPPKASDLNTASIRENNTQRNEGFRPTALEPTQGYEQGPQPTWHEPVRSQRVKLPALASPRLRKTQQDLDFSMTMEQLTPEERRLLSNVLDEDLDGSQKRSRVEPTPTSPKAPVSPKVLGAPSPKSSSRRPHFWAPSIRSPRASEVSVINDPDKERLWKKVFGLNDELTSKVFKDIAEVVAEPLPSVSGGYRADIILTPRAPGGSPGLEPTLKDLVVSPARGPLSPLTRTPKSPHAGRRNWLGLETDSPLRKHR